MHWWHIMMKRCCLAIRMAMVSSFRCNLIVLLLNKFFYVRQISRRALPFGQEIWRIFYYYPTLLPFCDVTARLDLRATGPWWRQLWTWTGPCRKRAHHIWRIYEKCALKILSRARDSLCCVGLRAYWLIHPEWLIFVIGSPIFRNYAGCSIQTMFYLALFATRTTSSAISIDCVCVISFHSVLFFTNKPAANFWWR